MTQFPYDEPLKAALGVVLRVSPKENVALAFLREAMIAEISPDAAVQLIDDALQKEALLKTTSYRAPFFAHIAYDDVFLESLCQRAQKNGEAFDLLAHATAQSVFFGLELKSGSQRKFAAKMIVGTQEKPKGSGARRRKDVAWKLAAYIATAAAAYQSDLRPTRGKENSTVSAADAAAALLTELGRPTNYQQVADVVSQKADADVRQLAEWMLPDYDFQEIFGK